MAIYFYSHDVAYSGKTGITKVGFITFKAFNELRVKFILISNAKSKNINRELEDDINLGIGFKRLTYRTRFVRNPFKRILMTGLNFFKFRLNRKYFTENDTIIFNHIEYTDEFYEFLKSFKALSLSN